MQSMIESGQVVSFQQLAEIGRISQPRMTQIMSLLNLAPDIQEELLQPPGSQKPLEARALLRFSLQPMKRSESYHQEQSNRY